MNKYKIFRTIQVVSLIGGISLFGVGSYQRCTRPDIPIPKEQVSLEVLAKRDKYVSDEIDMPFYSRRDLANLDSAHMYRLVEQSRQDVEFSKELSDSVAKLQNDSAVIKYNQDNERRNSENEKNILEIVLATDLVLIASYAHKKANKYRFDKYQKIERTK